MDGASLQAKLYRGYAKAAERIGLPHDLYRPGDPLAPLTPASKLATIPASFHPGSYHDPAKYGNAIRHCVADGARLRPGDYLQGDATFFIAAMRPLLPILAVECNRILAFARLPAPSAVGALLYQADLPEAEIPYLAGWPASVLQGSKGGMNETRLPGDGPQAEWSCLLPQWNGLRIYPADIVTDELGNRYLAGACELTALGWRLTLQQATV